MSIEIKCFSSNILHLMCSFAKLLSNIMWSWNNEIILKLSFFLCSLRSANPDFTIFSTHHPSTIFSDQSIKYTLCFKLLYAIYIGLPNLYRMLYSHMHKWITNTSPNKTTTTTKKLQIDWNIGTWIEWFERKRGIKKCICPVHHKLTQLMCQL